MEKTFLTSNGKWIEGSVEKKTIKTFLHSFIQHTRAVKSPWTDDEAKIEEFLNDYSLNTVLAFTKYGQINSRTIKCSCGDPECEVGISFDENIMRFHDRYGNEHNIELNESNVNDIIKNLKEL